MNNHSNWQDLQKTATGPLPSEPASEDLLAIDFRALFAALRRRLWTIIGVVVLGCVATLAYAFTTTPYFTSTVSILIDPRESQVVDVEAVLSGLPPDSNTIDTEVEVIQSSDLIGRVIDRLKLMRDPEINTALDPDVFDPVGYLKSFLPKDPVSPAEQDRINYQMAVQLFRDRMGVKRSGLTYVINVSFTSQDPEKAARIAGALADVYLVDQLEAKFAATQRANTWLSERLEGLRQEVNASERAVEKFRADNNLTDVEGTLINEQQMSEINAQLIIARSDLARDEARLQTFQNLLKSGGDADTLSEAIQSETITRLREQQAEVVREKAELETRYGARHPQIVRVNRELSDLQQQIAAEIRRIVTALITGVDVTRERVNSLNRDLRKLEGESSSNQQALVQLRELSREADASRTLYESFLGRFKETTEQGTYQEADARILANATIPVEPSWPQKPLLLALAFVLSGLVGTAIAFLLEQLENGFFASAQLEAALGYPVLSVIPALRGAVARDSKGKAMAPHTYLLHKPFSGFSEAFRSLSTALTLSDVDRPPRTIVFTSSMPGEGKTTSAICFARSQAKAGKNVILVDCDLRNSSLSERLDITADHGLVELLSGHAQMDDVTLRDDDSGLVILPLKSRPANPQGLLQSDAFRTLIDTLADQYDLVIFDSAPLLPVSDTQILSQYCDTSVFAVRWQVTPREACKRGIRELSQATPDIAGVIFTQVDMVKQGRYGYGYGDATQYYRSYSKYYVD